MSPTNENNAIHLLKKHNEAGLKILVDLYYSKLFRYAFKLTGSREVSEEITQDIFVYLWEKRSALHMDSVVGYLMRMVRNRCFDHYRKRVFLTDIHEADPNLFVEKNNPDVEHQELNEIISTAVDELPEKCAVILRLSRFSGLSHQEISDQLGISKKTIENQVTIALKRIRKKLEEHGYSMPLAMIAFTLWLLDKMNEY